VSGTSATTAVMTLPTTEPTSFSAVTLILYLNPIVSPLLKVYLNVDAPIVVLAVVKAPLAPSSIAI